VGETIRQKLHGRLEEMWQLQARVTIVNRSMLCLRILVFETPEHLDHDRAETEHGNRRSGALEGPLDPAAPARRRANLVLADCAILKVGISLSCLPNCGRLTW
jgi:hypothetical protein